MSAHRLHSATISAGIIYSPVLPFATFVAYSADVVAARICEWQQLFPSLSEAAERIRPLNSLVYRRSLSHRMQGRRHTYDNHHVSGKASGQAGLSHVSAHAVSSSLPKFIPLLCRCGLREWLSKQNKSVLTAE